MNKTKIIVIVVALAVALGLIWLVSRGSGVQQTSKLDAIDTVGNFYEQWLKAAQKPTDADPDQKTLAKSPILSKMLRDRLVEAQKTPNVTPDPVLCQTVTPENISTRRVYESADKAQILVTSRDKEVTDQATVTLTRLNDGWYIEDIECSLGEFAPDREFSFESEGYLLKGSIPPPYDSKNWHLVFEERGVKGHVVPIFFSSTSECTSLGGEKALCRPEQFQEATKVFIQGQMTERGVEITFLNFVK